MPRIISEQDISSSVWTRIGGKTLEELANDLRSTVEVVRPLAERLVQRGHMHWLGERLEYANWLPAEAAA